MDQSELQTRVEQFLQELGMPGFIVFGYMQEEGKCEIVSSYNEMPINVAIKGLSDVVNQLISRTL